MNKIIDIFNKHNYLGEHGGKANILLSSTVDGVFSITLEDEDEDNGFKSSWEMTMHRDAAEKVARKFAEMLGIIPIERKNERRCGMINARTTSSQILIEEMEPTKINAPTVEPARLQGEWIPIKMRPGTDEEYEEFSQNGDCPREDFRVFDCPLPDDDQKVLVTTQWGDVCVDIWHRDVDCCYFEDNSDDDDVIAWMPLPEGYKKGGAES